MGGTNDLWAMVRRGIAVALSTSLALAQQTPQTPQWRQLPPIGPFLTLASYEEPGGAFVVLGGEAPGVRAWRWAGGWQEIVCSTAPPVRPDAAVAYDAARGVAVLFGGGITPQPLGDTWEFDGADWTLRTPPVTPSPRTAARLGYDLIRQRCVLFGGNTANGPLDDTWEYDGTTWSQVVTPQTPPPLAEPGMCFDLAQARMLLIGDAMSPTPQPCQTWAFDGATWQQLPTATPPPSRYRPRCAYDLTRQQAVLFGGMQAGPFGTQVLSDTWVFDGSDWSQVNTGTTPPGRYSTDATWSSLAQGVVVFGGSYYTTTRYSAAMHVFDGTDWLELMPEAPFRRVRPLLAFDSARDALVLHGGVDENGVFQQETWEWYGGTWVRTASGTGPGSLVAGMAFDPVRARVVAIDGGTTWEYATGVWGARTLTPSPTDGAICYDRHAGAIRVAAGSQTWTFDGVAWSPTTTSGAVPTSSTLRATHWSATDRIVAATAYPYSTAAFDGSSWTPIATFTSPTSQLAEDALRGVLVGIDLPQSATAVLRSLQAPWQLVPPALHEDIWSLTPVGDIDRGVVFGVSIGGHVWQLEWPGTASLARFGRGCPGSQGTPSLDGIGAVQPLLGQPLPLRLTSLPFAPGLGVLALGDSITATAAAPLPIPLDAIGLPGCALWSTPLVSVTFAHGGAQVQLLPSLPLSPALAGSLLTLQAFVLDPAATNGLGSVSNAVLVIPR